MGSRTKYYHADEVAAKYGCTMGDVYKALNDGRLRGYKKGRKWLVNMDQEDEFKSLGQEAAARRAVFDERIAKSRANQETVAALPEYIKYVEDEDHSRELLSRVMNVRKSLSISTANLKNLYLPVAGADEKVPFLKFLEDLVSKGVTVNILYSRLSSVLYEEKDKYPVLMKSKLFHSKICGMVHMKMFIFDEEEVYIGSANITNAAIGNRTKKANNFEAGLITNNKDIVDRAISHFTKAWEKDCGDCPIMDKCCEKDEL